MVLKLAIFISGRGSNMEALLQACASADYPAEVVLVLSNNPDAKGLETAASAGIATEVVDHRNFKGDKAGFENAILTTLDGYDIDLICLAGFMRLLSADFIAHWTDKIINIHPSLLPAYKGLDTHARAIADGAQKAGCSVHFVVPEMDAGPIILQKEVAIDDGETADSLAAKVLVQEHTAYPEAVKLVAEGRIKIIDEQVRIV
ncbi:MAG TPA: phosphoribosylglycinamide formyltransferase [Micavibrio sp.]|nr:phosphoribosylglycinamide formyltransferase [Micavibrio sp.]HIL29028.1 phosphoribosylglycinamide formyltransferase [Micavibrio sp.]